ncbi:MAG: YceH family protein [Solirubrobacterales bacterium]
MNAAVPQLDPVEARILGCLIEKQHTTPAGYPLTLNALRLACNQSTNRDPVVDYDEEQIFDSIQRLHRMELTRSASGHGSRSAKYRHLAAERLSIDDAGEAVLAVLLLRGPQTPGELKTRTERMHAFDDLGELDRVLTALIDAGYVERLERGPGEKQERYRELFTDSAATEQSPAHVDTPGESLEARVARLEAEVAELRLRLG